MTAKVIRIGDVSFPLEDYAIVGNAVLGIRGAGKTFLAKSIAEQLLAFQVPIVAFDPIGVWRHLRRPASARGKGFKIVVAGGEEPDLPLTPESAPELVRAAIRESIPLVIDLYDRRLSKSDWRKIVRACFRTLMYENKGVRHIFLEETAEFAPQRIDDGETYAEVEKVVRMGGNVSLGVTLINQRAQEVNKAVLDLCENLVLMRQRGQKAIEQLTKWLEHLDPDSAKKIAAGMPSMANGDAWVFEGTGAPPQLTRAKPLASFHPDRRRPELLNAAGAPADHGDFVARMSGELAQLVEKAKADDPKALKARIRELEAAAKRAPSVAPAPAATAPRDRGAEQEQSRRIAALERNNAALKEYSDQLFAGAALSQTLVEELEEKVRALRAVRYPRQPKLVDVVQSSAPVARTVTPAPARQPTVAPAPRISNGSRDPRIGKSGKARIMIALAQNPAGANQRRLSLLSGLSARSGTWSTYLSELRGLGFVDGSDVIRATEAGIAALGEYEPLPTGPELVAYWQNRLGNSGKRAIFDVLVSAYPRAVPVDEVAEAAKMSNRSGTWSTYLSELRGLELISGRGELKASADLFD